MYLEEKIVKIPSFLGPFGPKEIDGLLLPPGIAYTLLTDHLITGYPLRSEPAEEKWVLKPCIQTSLRRLLGWLYLRTVWMS